MNRYRKMPMQRRILWTFVLLVLLILTVIITMLTAKTIGDENRRYSAILQQACDQIDARLESIMGDIRYTSSTYLLGSNIADYMANDFYAGRKEYVETLRNLRSNTLSVRINPNISSITYLTDTGALYSGAGYNTEYLAYMSQIAQQLRQSGEKYLVTPAYETTINQQSVTTVTYAFRVASPYTLKPVGCGFINVDIKRLAQSFSVLSVGETVGAFAMQNGRSYFSASETASAIAAQTLPYEDEIRETSPFEFHAKSGGESYLCVARWNSELSVSIVSYVPMAIISSQAMNGILLYLFTVVLMLAVFVVLSYFMAAHVTKPIRVLQDGMRQVEHGCLAPITEQVDRPDDMGDLIRGFNNMLTRLKQSILREYESRDMERKAQIELLQNQINPHFLYNALNLITSIGELEDVPEIPQIATSLADLFRYNISGAQTVALSEEIAQIERYIAIQKLCMAGNLHAEYHVTEAAGCRRVLKFLLQPLVENSLVHGVGKSVKDGLIVIDARVTAEDRLLISVHDNGVGIPPETLARLQERCAQDAYNRKDESIGLLNVHFRLRAAYGDGDDYGLQIESVEGEGTTIRFCLPPEE